MILCSVGAGLLLTLRGLRKYAERKVPAVTVPWRVSGAMKGDKTPAMWLRSLLFAYYFSMWPVSVSLVMPEASLR